MKSYTDLQQSKKLAKILPLESADMYYWCGEDLRVGSYKAIDIDYDIPCWSLAALIDYLSANFRVDIKYLDNYWELDCRVQVTYNKELVDACYEVIIKLNELNLL